MQPSLNITLKRVDDFRKSSIKPPLHDHLSSKPLLSNKPPFSWEEHDLMISNFLYLAYSSSLRRTDTVVFAKLNKPPSQVSLLSLLTPHPSNVFELNKPPPGL